MLRQLIVSVVGHVDHGKSSILDSIRNTSIIKNEAGNITQAIGASLIPMESVMKICGELLKKKDIKIPGLLFIDTPGHAAFTSLRKRGGSLADLAILVVDINEGFKPQTKEALEILKQSKTPFVVAANKIDLIPGWERKEKFFLKNYSSQNGNTKENIDSKIYELVGRLFEYGFNSERFDRVSDYSKQIAIVPCSAKSSEGIPELLAVLIGLAQRFMTKELEIDLNGPARGVILEVKEAKGLGKVLDALIYNGILKVRDEIVIGGIGDIIRTRVKILQKPAALRDIRDVKTSFVSIPKIESAAAVRISAPNIEGAIAGMPFISLNGISFEDAEEELKRQINEVVIDTDNKGIIIKADSLGSLEALIKMLKERGIQIKKASIGEITKKDIIEAEANLESEPLDAVILGFNAKPNKEAEELLKKSEVHVIYSDIIYAIIDEFKKWKEDSLKKMQEKELSSLIQPSKIRILPGYVFRQSNPAIVGVEVLNGKLCVNTPLMNSQGKVLTTVKTIQEEKDNIHEANAGKQVAISLEHVIIGRQINENDVLYSAVPEEDFRKFKELKELLSDEQKNLLKEIADIMRKNDPFWGV